LGTNHFVTDGMVKTRATRCYSRTKSRHAGVTIGEYWFITGGGNSRKGNIEISHMFIAL